MKGICEIYPLIWSVIFIFSIIFQIAHARGNYLAAAVSAIISLILTVSGVSFNLQVLIFFVLSSIIYALLKIIRHTSKK